ncbi:MAG: quinol:cytochrome C oxidoreductase [Bacteroidetes bacterium]|nr:quinol:cytochrome C oxidoreductase [Bacteroidota bacterium]
MTPIQLQGTPFISKLQKVALGAIVVGALGLAVAFATDSDHTRLLADYLIGFIYFAGIAVTAMFFSALQFLVKAGWSTSVRRIAENFAGFVPYLIIGMIPIYLFKGELFHWVHEVASDPIISGKAPFLNTTFFGIRLALYCGLWYYMYRFIVGNSKKQDTATDYSPTYKNLKRAAPFVVLYAFTITFASFDLLMSLEPHWYSTIFGVYFFAGNFVATLSLICIYMINLYKGGYLKNYVTLEHFHDIGKFMFAFTIFWTYIAFSQYFLIWYGNIPEETIYYVKRLQGGWELFGWGSIFLHFIVPFLMLLRQDVKRRLPVMMAGACLLLLAHFIDLCWIVLPVFSKTLIFGYQEITAWLFFFGLFTYIVAKQFASNNLIPVNDPYIKESIELVS